MVQENYSIGVVGLGYVGLHLGVAFAKKNKHPVIGFDINPMRIEELQKGFDKYQEIPEEILNRVQIMFSNDPRVLRKANFIIVAVPTPIDNMKKPDLSYLENASRIVGENLTRNSIVVFESTVYPGVTEEFCVPIIESSSNLKCGIDWAVGYSPERINPGDKEHGLENIVKVVAGMNEETTQKIADVYKLICKQVYKAKSIKVAEAAKVIENIQRDLNIALMNELAIIFHREGLDFFEILKAAETKWNWNKYYPGLVGGHCIPVDPYYLTHRAIQLGHHPEVILAGRRINDEMYKYIGEMSIKALAQAQRPLSECRILILGATYKPNVSDIRNSQVKRLCAYLNSFGVKILLYEPIVEKRILQQELSNAEIVYDVNEIDDFDMLLLAIPHDIFSEELVNSLLAKMKKPIVVDVHGKFIHLRDQNSCIIYRSLLTK